MQAILNFLQGDATLLQYIIICPLALLGGFVDAVAGGGGLVAFPAFLIAGIPVHAAIGTSKISSGMGTAVATFKYAKSGFVPWKLATCCAITSLVGAFSGAKLALLISEGVFKIIMLFILPLTAVYVLRGRSLDAKRKPFSEKKTLALGSLVALLLGAYDGFYGPGSGTFLLLLLTGMAHLSLNDANGVAKVITLVANVSGALAFVSSGDLLPALGIVAGCFGIVGSYLGAKFFTRGGAKVVKPLIIFVLSVFFIKIIAEIFGLTN